MHGSQTQRRLRREAAHLEVVNDVHGTVALRVLEVQLHAQRELAPSAPPQREWRLDDLDDVVGGEGRVQKEADFGDEGGEVQVGLVGRRPHVDHPTVRRGGVALVLWWGDAQRNDTAHKCKGAVQCGPVQPSRKCCR